MRLTLLIITLLFSAAAQCAGHSPSSVVFTYECKHINPKETGFSCHFDHKPPMTISWKENPDSMNPERREYAMYQFDKITLRYLELGGNGFDVTFPQWENGKVRHCAHLRGKPYYSYTCFNSDTNEK